MILVLFFIVRHQFLLNEALRPFIKFLPITHKGVGLYTNETFCRARLTEQSSQLKPHRKIRQEDLKVINQTNRLGARRQQIYASEAYSSTVSHLLNISFEEAVTQDSIQNLTEYLPFTRAHHDIEGLFPIERSYLLQ
jgi:hypothetical protein